MLITLIIINNNNNNSDCVRVTGRGFGLEIGFIHHFQVVTTNNNNTIANFHTL
jgi:hypothetical protein